MDAHGAIRSAMNISSMILKSYLGDLEDSDLMSRPGEGCNHLAWQLGHLISAEHDLLESICPGTAASLPEGFAEQHNKEKVGDDDPAKFCTKEEYLAQMDRVRVATDAALDKLSAGDLDQPSPEHFRKMFPTVGDVFMLISTHGLMHAGQFVPVRRRAGKPIAI